MAKERNRNKLKKCLVNRSAVDVASDALRPPATITEQQLEENGKGILLELPRSGKCAYAAAEQTAKGKIKK